MDTLINLVGNHSSFAVQSDFYVIINELYTLKVLNIEKRIVLGKQIHSVNINPVICYTTSQKENSVIQIKSL